MSQAYISLLSNSGNRTENLNRAVWAINSLKKTKVSAVSRVYEADLKEYKKQPPFFCAAVRIETELPPEMLLGCLLGIEAVMGKTGKKNEPIFIDLDLLTYEEETSFDELCTLPHPKMLERAYILAALLSIYPDKKYKERLRELGENNVKVTGEGLYMPL